MLNINKKAFTLVELIVVITILAILGTIGFISLQGYSSEARDSKRVTDLGQIRTGIHLYQAKEGVVPEPNDAITVGSGSTIYTIQGYAGTGTLRSIKVNTDALDPLSNDYYTYTTNGTQTKFQLLTLLENNNTAYNNVIPTTYADYENRKSYTIGDQLGTLLEPTTNIPVQELGNNIDLSVNTTEYLPVFSREDNTAKYSGLSLAQEMENRIGSTTCLTSGNCEGPSGGSFTINSGATTTNSRSVTLNVTCPTEYMGSSVEIAYGNTTNPSNWTTCTQTISHELTTGDGQKTVYVKFRDSYGNESGVSSVGINLDIEYYIEVGPGLTSYYTNNGKYVLLENNGDVTNKSTYINKCVSNGYYILKTTTSNTHCYWDEESGYPGITKSIIQSCNMNGWGLNYANGSTTNTNLPNGTYYYQVPDTDIGHSGEIGYGGLGYFTVNNGLATITSTSIIDYNWIDQTTGKYILCVK